MSCRFPGGIEGPSMFWQAIKDGKCLIQKVPFSRWDVDAVIAQNPTLTDHVKQCMMHGGFIHDLELFDANFFLVSLTQKHKKWILNNDSF
jgi:acyl transferase domain-containing protein